MAGTEQNWDSMQHLGYVIPPQADAGWIGEVGPRSEWDKGERFDFVQPNPEYR